MTPTARHEHTMEILEGQAYILKVLNLLMVIVTARKQNGPTNFPRYLQEFPSERVILMDRNQISRIGDNKWAGIIDKGTMLTSS